MHYRLLIYILLFSPLFAYSQQKQKVYEATRTQDHIQIDGKLTEEAWKMGNLATDFIALEPVPGEKAHEKTDVTILYSDEAIYIGAHLHDVAKDSILKELTERDQIGNTDWFGFVVDTYRDEINGFEFIVTAAGVQFDAKLSAFGEDSEWNAVWYSETTITDEGWYCEMKIPYSAIRFPEKKVQDWNINIIRSIRRIRQKVFWNEIKPTVNGFLTQSGRMEGLEDIVAPFRLSITPYVAFGFQNDQNNEPGNQNIKSFSGGMDLKYGINDAFTLDMTLIPDFSQVQSDNTVLNLSQFEVKYDENRQFFTEGTELFNKADLIYFRRVGGVPIGYFEVETLQDSGYTIQENPERQQLINAVKISGRNKKGLGVGVFNGLTNNTYSYVTSEDGNSEKILTDPLTNYNAFVLDQNLKNNSYVSLINTNVSRQGDFYNANVLGTQFKFMDNNNMYGVEGFGSWSSLYGDSKVEYENQDGFESNVQLGKYGGNFNAWISNRIVSDTYNRNDMGYITLRNIVTTEVGMNYNIYEPFGNYNRAGAYIGLDYTNLYNSGAFADFGIYHDLFLITRDFNAYGYSVYLAPIKNHDYWEARTPGRYYLQPENYGFGAWFSSDYRKTFAFDINIHYRTFNSDRYRLNLSFSPRVRLNDKVSFILELNNYNYKNDIGWVDEVSSDIILGQRNINTLETLLNLKYTFTNKMGLNFRLRHYWSNVEYNNYFLLDMDGTLSPTDYSNFDEYGADQNNINFNIFNIDMVYRWVFSPGSEINFIWKNVIQDNNVNVKVNYFQNFQNTLEQDQINSFTLKVLYFLDYLWVKKLVTKNQIRNRG